MAEIHSDSDTFEASVAKSEALSEQIPLSPHKFRVLTGDRPTGRLHIGHLFGSLELRVKLQNLGVETFVVIADYQVLTDRDVFDGIAENTMQLAIDYLAAGLDPSNGRTFIFPHSHVPELNQLLVPFLTLVSTSELDKNPTVKEEIAAASLRHVNAGMYTYPVHQAADILFCHANVVPVGKDQLPHIELTRTIARRFNKRFACGNQLFPEPTALLTKAPTILGLDGTQKMSKSRNNAVMLSATEEETARLIKGAKTDSVRQITYEPTQRPAVANLLRLAGACTGRTPEVIACELGDKGAGALKEYLTVSLNEYLRPLRAQRKELEQDRGLVRDALKRGVTRAREVGDATLAQVRKVMNMQLL